MERVESDELLDREGWSRAQVDCALYAIRRANRWYGGDRLHLRLYERVIERSGLRRIDILEVASARGEVVQSAARRLAQKGVLARVWLMDRSAAHLPGPGDWDHSLSAPTLLVGNALAIPLPDKSVDIVSCCLFLHHLGPGPARAFLREATRVARVAVAINDVERSRVHYGLSLLNRLIDPSELSRFDGPASVRQAHTKNELAAMLRETGRPYELERYFLYRLGAILWT